MIEIKNAFAPHFKGQKLYFSSQIFGMLVENIKIALTSIRSQSLRTALTVFIIGIGIMALVGILTVVSALENTLSSDFASMGANTFSIQRYDASQSLAPHGSRGKRKPNPPITYNDARQFKSNYDYPLTYTSVSFTATSNAEVKTENKKTDPEASVLGIDEHYFRTSGYKFEQGRGFTNSEVENNMPVCVVGSDFMKNLFATVDPIDQQISLRGMKFKVVGVLEEKGSTFGNSQDLRVFIPIQLARSLYSQANVNYSIMVMTDKKEMLDQATDQAIVTFRNIRGLTPAQENNFGISRSDDLVNRIKDMTVYLEIAAWVIGAVTIFGSSIALMNIMLVSVTERTREIGIRKSLGATSKLIAQQFFVETLVIGQIGGLIGMTLGILLGFGVATAMKFAFTIPWMAIIASFITSFIVALFSGLYPAVKASRLDPIEALRYE